MSRRRDWIRAKQTERAVAQRRFDAQHQPHSVVPQKLVPIIEQAVEAKQAGRFFQMPNHLTPAEAKRVWAVTFQLLKSSTPKEDRH